MPSFGLQDLNSSLNKVRLNVLNDFKLELMWWPTVIAKLKQLIKPSMTPHLANPCSVTLRD